MISLVKARPSRRRVVQGGTASLLAFLGCGSFGGRRQERSSCTRSQPRLGFSSVPTSRADAVVLPPGYSYHVVSAWGDPVVAGARPFSVGAGAAAQALCAGMSHDGMALFPVSREGNIADRALMAVNYEYTDDNLLSPDGMLSWSAEKVALSKSAHGVGILEIAVRRPALETGGRVALRTADHRRHADRAAGTRGGPRLDADRRRSAGAARFWGHSTTARPGRRPGERI